jgi:hypothetical protein
MKINCYGIVLIFILGYICISPVGFSQTKGAKSESATCLRLIYNFEFDSVRLHYPNFEASDVHSKNLIELFAMRWENIPIVNSSKKEIYREELAAAARSLSESDQKSDENLYLHITSELLLSEFHYTNGDGRKTLWHGKEVYPLIMKAFDENRNEPELLFVRAMFLYYIDFFRNKGIMYRIALFPFRDGDKELGLRLLQEAANAESLAQTEARIYCAHILLHLENKPKQALPYSEKLVEAYPANPKFRELLIDNLIAQNRFQEADVELKKQLTTSSAYFKIPALYFAGRSEAEFRKNKDGAAKLFQECIDLSLETGLQEDYQDKAKQQLKSLE